MCLQFSAALLFELFKVLRHSSYIVFSELRLNNSFPFDGFDIQWKQILQRLPVLNVTIAYIAKRRTTNFKLLQRTVRSENVPTLSSEHLRVLGRNVLQIVQQMKVFFACYVGPTFPRCTFSIWIWYIIYKVKFDNNAIHTVYLV